MPMTFALSVFRDRRLQPESPPFEEISELLGIEDAFVWVELTSPTEQELRLLQEEFSLPDLAVEDAIDRGQRPKVDRYGDVRYTAAYSARMDGLRVQLTEIHMFAAPRFVITVQHDPGWDVAAFGKRLSAVPDAIPLGGGWAAYVLLDEVVDTYFAILDVLGESIADLEEALLHEETGPDRVDLLRETYATRRDLVHLRRVVAPLRDVLSIFGRRDEHVLSGNLDDYFRDLWDHVVTVYDEIDASRDMLSAALEGHMSVVSNRLNGVVLRVSAWAAIIAVPTFIASVYGMNFVRMPELHWAFGYPAALGGMIVIAGLLYWAFHRRGWL
jgi:magnesium transporter